MTMTLRTKLASGEVLLLDGGIGSEIQRRGVAPDPSAWSGASHMEHPDVVRRIHRDYIEAGAQVITANTFSSAPHILERIGLGDRADEINRAAVAVAREARDAAATGPVWVAGSLSTIPPADRPDTIPNGPGIADNYRRQADSLAAAGADLLIAEMMLDSAGAGIVVDACLATGLPVWVGFSASFGPDGHRVNGFRAPGKYTAMADEPLDQLLDRVLDRPVAAAGIMHTKLPVMAPALSVLAQAWDGPKLAYAETGSAGVHDWSFAGIATPALYAEQARSWIEEFGVRIVGGCCGTGPEHIAALSVMIAGLEPAGAA